jgi:hypothetical protein
MGAMRKKVRYDVGATSVRAPLRAAQKPRRLPACVRATAFSIAMLAAALGPAAAATASGVASHSATAATAVTTAYTTPNIPDSVHWVYWGPYPTLHACNVEGDHLVLAEEINSFKCIQASGGEYIYYQLWILPGHPPGS